MPLNDARDVPVISIITAIRNQLPANRLFLESIRRYTTGPYELIIIDNQSTDGSKEFFTDAGARVIANDRNYSYPYCQNQGMEIARGEYYAFLNNDIVVCQSWDSRLIEVMKTNNIDVITPTTNDRLESDRATRRILRRWKRAKYPFLYLLGNRSLSLRLMFKVMYGNWDAWTQRRFAEFGMTIMEGFSGSSVIWSKKARDILGCWDPKIQGADFDLFRRTKERFEQTGDMRPVQVALGVYFHHFQKLTAKTKNPPFWDHRDLEK